METMVKVELDAGHAWALALFSSASDGRRYAETRRTIRRRTTCVTVSKRWRERLRKLAMLRGKNAHR